MNETIHTILSRRSVRSYTDKPVEQEKLETIIKCGQFAPSASNRQPWHFTLITDRGLLDQISKANQGVLFNMDDESVRQRASVPRFDSFHGAPVAIIVSGEESAKYAMGDCANAIENMFLAVHALGLGGCYLASFKIAMETPIGIPLLKACKIPPGFIPMFALSIGYPAGELGERAPRRKGTLTII